MQRTYYVTIPALLFLSHLLDTPRLLTVNRCVYFAQLANSNGAITHTGDEREGDEDLGEGDDEVIM
jgi:stress response protein SCP2